VIRRLAFAALLLASACKRGGDAAPACGAVGARFYMLVRADLDKTPLDPARARALEDQLPAMRDALVASCTEGKWSPEVRTCLTGAGDHVTFEACEQHLTDDQRKLLERSARGEDAAAKSSPD